MGISLEVKDHIADVVIDVPPVNALPSDAWFDLAGRMLSAGADSDVRVVRLRAEGRGFCAGVDIKRLAADTDNAEIIAVNKGCAAAFAAIYECEVPVVVAVQGFCLGGGIGLVGNADVIVASEEARFGLPEAARGALGAATHLARLVPQQRMRYMLYTGAEASASELMGYGSIHSVVPADDLDTASWEVSAEIAKVHPTVIRAAKQALNGIDPVDVRRSYRFEQGFTFELNLTNVAKESQQAFLDKRDPSFES